MIQANEQAVRTVVEEVLAQLGNRDTVATSPDSSVDGDWGVFSKVDDAVTLRHGRFVNSRRRRSRIGPGR